MCTAAAHCSNTARLWTFPVAELFQAEGPLLCAPRHGHDPTRAHARAHKVESAGWGVRRDEVGCAPAACSYLPLSSSSTKSRWCHAAMLSATPPDERLRERERERRETAVERRRGRGRRGGECLCLAVMAYSQGRSDPTKPVPFPCKYIYTYISSSRSSSIDPS